MRLKISAVTALAFAAAVCLTNIASAQVRVVKSAGDSDPTLYFRGLQGNQQLSDCVASDLKNCGWFEVTSGPSADIQVSGTADPAVATLSVSGTSTFGVSERLDPQNLQKTADKLVDALLKKMFNIPGICSSRIALCVETSPGIKEIAISDIGGKNILKLTSNNTLCVEPAWTPDGKSLVYTLYGKSYADLVQMDISHRKSRRVAQYPGLNSGGSVSPNGRNLALILSRDNTVELYLKSLDGSSLKRLTNSPAVEGCPCWSPRGSQLCYASDEGGSRPHLYTMDVPSGTNVRRLPTIGSEAVSPDWSADDKIVYSAKSGGEYNLAVINMKGGDCDVITGQPIINSGGSWEGPSWAPDRRHVVCERVSGSKSSIFIVDARTGKFKEIISGRMNCSMPSWSPLLP
jgi:TolB protein